jgi:hypothetical protein
LDLRGHIEADVSDVAGLVLTHQAAGSAFDLVFLKNSRKTERGAKQFLTRMAVRAAPFAPLKKQSHRRRVPRQVLCVCGVRGGRRLL